MNRISVLSSFISSISCCVIAYSFYFFFWWFSLSTSLHRSTICWEEKSDYLSNFLALAVLGMNGAWWGGPKKIFDAVEIGLRCFVFLIFSRSIWYYGSPVCSTFIDMNWLAAVPRQPSLMLSRSDFPRIFLARPLAALKSRICCYNTSAESIVPLRCTVPSVSI